MRWLVAALLSFVAACEAALEPEPATTLEIGTGTWRFEPVADGGEVPLVYGAQGGWHLWLAIRVRGVAADSASLEVVHYPLASPHEPVRVAHGVHLDPENPEGFRAYLGWPAILERPACSVGHRYRLEVTLRPATGGKLSAVREVVVGAGDHPPPACEP